MNATAIEIRRLTRYFGDRPVVRDLDFSVPTGKVTALLGLNGAGKTTTIRIMMGLLAPTRGQAITLGEDASQLSVNARARIGYLVEGHFLYPSMRVVDCEAYQRVGYETWDDSMFREIVNHFRIDPSARVSTLSRGQRAGVSLGLVLAPNPELLVLDDPALGLDPVSRRALNETLIEFAGGGKRTVLLSTHLLDDVERIADRVAVMVGGRLKVDATLESFRERVTMYTVTGTRGLSLPKRFGWTAAAALLGLGTVVAVLAIYPKLLCEPCSRCGEQRRIDLDDCEHCDRPWDAPATEGIEILERNSAEKRELAEMA